MLNTVQKGNLVYLSNDEAMVIENSNASSVTGYSKGKLMTLSYENIAYVSSTETDWIDSQSLKGAYANVITEYWNAGDDEGYLVRFEEATPDVQVGDLGFYLDGDDVYLIVKGRNAGRTIPSSVKTEPLDIGGEELDELTARCYAVME